MTGLIVRPAFLSTVMETEMKNFVQSGHSFSITAPSAGVVGGTGLLLAPGVFVVPILTAIGGYPVEVLSDGIIDHAKDIAVAVAVGDSAYWDDTSKVVTNVATGHTKIGIFVRADAQGATIGRVRLNGAY